MESDHAAIGVDVEWKVKRKMGGVWEPNGTKRI